MAENNDDHAPEVTIIDQERAMYHLRCLGVDCGWRAADVEDFIKDREAAMKAMCTEVGTRGATITQQADRIAALESTKRELREAVKVLAEYVVSVEAGASIATICHHQEMCDANPIAAAAVREAGR